MADHLSRLEGNIEKHGEIEIDDPFTDELIMAIEGKGTLWYAGFANYVASGVLPEQLSYH